MCIPENFSPSGVLDSEYYIQLLDTFIFSLVSRTMELIVDEPRCKDGLQCSRIIFLSVAHS